MPIRQLLAAAVMLALAPAASATPLDIHVTKTASCGCCAKWIDHMSAAGHAVTATDTDMGSLVQIKRKLKMPPRLASCHTATVGGYVIEGHVPAADVERLMAERPAGVVGLSVPGMPAGSPGMEYGSSRDAYDVLLVKADGSTEIWSSYAAQP